MGKSTLLNLFIKLFHHNKQKKRGPFKKGPPLNKE